MDADFIWARFIRSKTLLQLDSAGTVVAEARASAAAPTDHPLMLATLGVAHAMTGNLPEARALADHVEMLGQDRYVSPYFVALIRHGLGDVAGVMESLETAFDRRDFWLVFIGADPIWDPLREEPRFQDLIARAGLA